MSISIIISMYRTDQHLDRFLYDALKLSRALKLADIDHNFILIVNDGTKKERSALANLANPFKVLFVDREPIYASWNRGIKEAEGKFVTFWGVDDTRFAKAIIDGLNALQNSRADIAYFPFRYHRFVQIVGLKILAKVKTFTPPKFEKERFLKEMHLGPHFITRRALFERIGYFDESFKIAGDYEFQTRAAKADACLVRVLSTSGIFRNDGTTLSGSRNKLQAEENERVYSKII
ncbi:hypothetical protein CL644_01525 [bacterium]|nr:hypothetical protein [bacterium]|tara:strand:+ start:7056 stop:7757 length:702 start_codon:yes stop_codon:yes gene_type:complete